MRYGSVQVTFIELIMLYHANRAEHEAAQSVYNYTNKTWPT